MHTSKKMENNFLIDLISDCLFVFVGFAGSFIGLDSLPENETLVQAIATIPQTSTIDVLIKIFYNVFFIGFKRRRIYSNNKIHKTKQK